MEKSIFFGEKGLTSTSANTIANLAKEAYCEMERNLESVSFYGTSKCLLDQRGNSQNVVIVKQGNGEKSLSQIKEKLARISEYKSLIAWIREAIKKKESLAEELNGLHLQDYCEVMGMELPVRKSDPQMPKRRKPLTEKEYYDSLSVSERNRYYSLETRAAVIGKYVHPDGAFAKARKDFDNIINNPCEVIGTGHDSMVVEHKPVVSRDYVEDLFYELQKEHRNVQKELNSMKHACQQAVFESQVLSNKEYENAVMEYHAAVARNTEEYTAAMDKLSTEFSSYVDNERKRIGDLKIIIPDALKGVYDEVNGLGSKK